HLHRALADHRSGGAVSFEQRRHDVVAHRLDRRASVDVAAGNTIGEARQDRDDAVAVEAAHRREHDRVGAGFGLVGGELEPFEDGETQLTRAGWVESSQRSPPRVADRRLNWFLRSQPRRIRYGMARW